MTRNVIGIIKAPLEIASACLMYEGDPTNGLIFPSEGDNLSTGSAHCKNLIRDPTQLRYSPLLRKELTRLEQLIGRQVEIEKKEGAKFIYND
jgi:hypothetical protein